MNNIRIRFPMYENECYAKRTRILRTMVPIGHLLTTYYVGSIDPVFKLVGVDWEACSDFCCFQSSIVLSLTHIFLSVSLTLTDIFLLVSLSRPSQIRLFQLAIFSQPTVSSRLILCSSWWESSGKPFPTSIVSSP